MIVVTCEQGSPEWFAARAGVITASMFGEVRKRLKSGPSKGDFTTAARDYAFRLAVERISGLPLDEGFTTWAMQRGNELEPMARMEHELQTGLVVTRAGFVCTDDRRFGASADGLIGIDGGSEYKCLVSPESLRSVLIDGDITNYIDQVQGCLWLTNRKWWDFCMYCPALESIGKQLFRLRVERDEEYIAAMEEDLLAFACLVDKMETALRGETA